MKHILVLSAEPSIRSLLSEILELEGYSVTKVAGVDDALMILRSALHPILAVVQLDAYSQPPPLSFFEQVRDQPDRYSPHHFMATSSWSYSEEDLEFLAALNAPLLQSPFTADELLTVVAEVAASLP
jgi:CheY-like chemotaxis protein